LNDVDHTWQVFSEREKDAVGAKTAADRMMAAIVKDEVDGMGLLQCV